MTDINITPTEDDPNAWMDEPETEEVTPWDVKNAVDAAEAMRRLRYFHERLDRLTAVKLAQIDQIDRWYEKECQKLQPNLDRYQKPLERWSEYQATQGSKEKTLSYPAGKIARRAGSESVNVADEQALIVWANAHPDLAESLIRTPPPVEPVPVAAKDVIKRAVKDGGPLKRNENGSLFDAETGEAIPGVSIVRKDPSYSIEFVEVENV